MTSIDMRIEVRRYYDLKPVTFQRIYIISFILLILLVINILLLYLVIVEDMTDFIWLDILPIAAPLTTCISLWFYQTYLTLIKTNNEK